jgi:acetate---CoA ligase (ADP-forming)
MHHDLRAAFNPASIAILGASDDRNKIGGRPLLYLRQFGFKGSVYPINPMRDQVQGMRAYPNLSSLPEIPELAIVALSASAAVSAVAECANAGVKIVVLMTAGFSESEGETGKRIERQMVEHARSKGMRIVGPNAQGLANFGTGAIANFSTMFLESPPADGPVAIISQSGAMSVVPYGLLRERGVGVRHSHGTGNDCDLTSLEIAAAVAADPAVKLLLLYVENLAEPYYLIEAARIANARGLPIILLKSGRTPAGQQAAQSHTGALASEDRVVDAFLARYGIWRAEDVADLVDNAELYLKGWTPQGRRLVVISNSGATCVIAADAAARSTMQIPRLSEATRARLSAILPSFAVTTNPVDITAALLSNGKLFGQILPVIAEDPAADNFLIGMPVAGMGYDFEQFAEDAAEFASKTGKPIIVSAAQARIRSAFAARGLTTFATEGQAIGALSRYLNHCDLMQRARKATPAASFQRLVQGTPAALNEVDSLARLSDFGLPVIDHRLCKTAAEALDAFAELGSHVAVKGCSKDIAHKSELDLVHLGITSESQVEAAFVRCYTVLKEVHAKFDGVIVASMAPKGRELIIGAHRDPSFGPIIVVGDGGKYVEAVPDSQVLLAPADQEAVRTALSRLRIAPILAGVRGEAPSDIGAFCKAAAALSNAFVEETNIASIDVNPMIVAKAGFGCVAVDAVVFEYR